MEFSTIKGFRKEYDKVREEILIRHGYKPGDKVRIKGVIVMFQDFNGKWVKMCNTKTDMEDRIKKYEGKGVFRLTALG